jgi:SET domain-containing protein
MSWTNTAITEVRSLANGHRSLFARADIKRDAVIAVLDGRAVVLDLKADGKIDYGAEDSNLLVHLAVHDGKFYGIAPIRYDEVAGADFMNHSCRPNCYVERMLVIRAAEDIRAGAELTWDYRVSDLVPQGQPCWCPEPKCTL